MRILAIYLAAVSAVVLATMSETALGDEPPRGGYVIAERQIEDIPEAMRLLRRFMSAKVPPVERCQRYAILLKYATTSHLTQYNIAELGLASSGQISQRYKSIDRDTLRELYFGAIRSFDEGPVDLSMLEVVKCMEDHFRRLDAKVMSFLNNDNLKETIAQYNSVMGQPLGFLLDPEAKHPSLAYENLKPAIKETLVDIFSGHVEEVEKRFGKVMPESIAPVVSESSPPSQVIEPTKAVPETRNIAAAAPESAPDTGVADEAADESVLVDKPVAPVAEPTLPTVNELPADELPGERFVEPEEESQVAQMVRALHNLYEEFPSDSIQADRCRSYAKLLDAEAEQLNEASFIDSIAKETSVVPKGPREASIYEPEKRVHDNFLFVLGFFDEQELGDGTWIDMVNCMSSWQSDPDVKKFMTDPITRSIFQWIVQESRKKATALFQEQAAGGESSGAVAGGQEVKPAASPSAN